MGLKSIISALILSLSCIITLAAAESYTLTAYAPATRAIHGKQINASGRRFIIGLEAPTSYCPDVPHIVCPPGTSTTVNDDLTALMVMTPGGQQVYVDPSGFVAYTQAHSSYVPANSTMKGFHRTTAKPSSPCDAEPTDLLDFCAPDGASKGVYACPNPDLAETWVLVAGGAQMRARRGDCVQLEGLEMHESEGKIGAWQYS